MLVTCIYNLSFIPVSTEYQLCGIVILSMYAMVFRGRRMVYFSSNSKSDVLLLSTALNFESVYMFLTGSMTIYDTNNYSPSQTIYKVCKKTILKFILSFILCNEGKKKILIKKIENSAFFWVFQTNI